MRRITSTLTVAVVALMATAAVGQVALAKKDKSGDTAGSPLVGAWLIDVNADDPTNAPTSSLLTADGLYLQVDPEGVGVGTWEATGPSSGALTILFRGPDENGAMTTTTVRADLEAAKDGQSLTATYTLEFVGPDGTSSGQLGPSTATGTRIAVEPMGTPVGPVPQPSPSASAGA